MYVAFKVGPSLYKGLISVTCATPLPFGKKGVKVQRLDVDSAFVVF